VRRAATLLLAAAAGCAGGPVTTPGERPLADEDYARPWALIRTVGSGKTIDAVTHGDAGYVALTHVETLDAKAMPSRTNIAAVSADGVSWSERAIDPDGDYRSIAFGAGVYVAVGGRFAGGGPGLVATSPDGRRWTLSTETASPLRRVRHTAAGFVAVGMEGGVVVSRDGHAWSEIQAPGRGLFWDGTFGAGRFVAVGQTMAVGPASGGPWSQVSCGPQLPCMSVTDPSGNAHAILELYGAEFGNALFLATGIAGLLRSPDGLTWTNVGEARDPLAFAAGQFLTLAPVDPMDAMDTAFRVSTSLDGTSWRDRTAANAVAASDATCAESRCLLLPRGILIIPPAP
jgi:hypothetical protein